MLNGISYWVQMYGRLIGVLAAVVLFGAWLIEKMITDRLNIYRDSIIQAQNAQSMQESFHRIEGKILEVYQVSASARQYAYEGWHRDQWTYLDGLYSDTELLERTCLARELTTTMLVYAERTNSFLSTINPPAGIRKEVNEATEELSELRNEFEKRRETYQMRQRNLVGEVINPNTITEEKARELKPAIYEFRDEVEFGIMPRFAPAANRLFRAYDQLFAYATSELQRREARAALARRFQLMLYTVGSLLAIYATYLEVVSKQVGSP